MYQLYEYEKDPTESSNRRQQQQQQLLKAVYTVHVPSSSTYNATTKNATTNQSHQQHQQCVTLLKEKRGLNDWTHENNNNNNNNNPLQKQRRRVMLPFFLHSIPSFVYGTIFIPIQNIMIRLILPVNYPHSVRTGYIKYQIYDSIQGLCSYLRNIVCSASILEAAGVGSISTNAWTAAIIWAIRDGTGLIGSLIYTYYVSGLLDAYVKEFRFFADIINDVGYTFDMILPLVSSQNTILFWLISSTSVLCKTMCGISAGATKSSITQHFALQGNMADLNAKESTQETIVTLLGMIGGIYIAKLLQYYESIATNGSNSSSNMEDSNSSNTKERSRTITWIFFVALTYIHIYANYCGIVSLRLRTMNLQRCNLCFHHNFIRNILQRLLLPSSSDSHDTKFELNLLDANSLRSILLPIIASPQELTNEIMFLTFWQRIVKMFRLYHHSNEDTISMNTTSSKLLQEYFHCSLIAYFITSKEKEEVKRILSSLRYNITFISGSTLSTQRQNRRNNDTVAVTLLSGATSYDELQAVLHAKIFLYMMKNTIPTSDELQKNSTDPKLYIYHSYRIVQLLFQPSKIDDSIDHVPLLISVMEQRDWDITRFFLDFTSHTRRFQLVATKQHDDDGNNSIDDRNDDLHLDSSDPTKGKKEN